MLERLKSFCVASKGVAELADTLGKNASVKIIVAHNGSLFISKTEGKIDFRTDDSKDGDIEIAIPVEMALEVVEKNPATAQDIIMFFVQSYFSEKYNGKIGIKIKIGLVKLTTKGYMNVIPIGGRTLLGFLKERGFGSMGAITKALKRFIHN